jgi:hypothetical protein
MLDPQTPPKLFESLSLSLNSPQSPDSINGVPRLAVQGDHFKVYGVREKERLAKVIFSEEGIEEGKPQ